MAESNGQRVAIIATDGFEQSELLKPMQALLKAGFAVDVIAPASGEIRGWSHTKWGKRVHVDHPIDEAKADDYEALVLPGGVMNPDKLRRDERVLEFVREIARAGKPIAAICHGPWTLIDAGLVEGRRMTSYPSIQTDLRNAGAEWVDEEVVVDNGIVTSRSPDDLPAFNRQLLEQLEHRTHAHAS